MEPVPQETQDVPIEKKLKNPWWTKVFLHWLIIGMFLDLIYGTTIAQAGIFFPFLVLFLWIVVLGPRIQSDKIILSKQMILMLLALVIWTTWEQYPNVIKIIHWIQLQVC